MKRAATGERLVAVSSRGSRPGAADDVVAILIGTPEVIAHVRASRAVARPVRRTCGAVEVPADPR